MTPGTPNSPSSPTLITAIAEGALLLAALLAVPTIVLSDYEVFTYGISEYSLTETLQALLLLFTTAIFWLCWWREPSCRGFLAWPAGLFSVMLVREMDHFLDHIFHGAWLYFALAVLAVSVALGWRGRAQFRAGLQRYLVRQAHAYILIGLVLVIAFSRVFGSGGFINAILGEAHIPTLKTFIQEGLELAGYIILAWGALRYRVDSQPRGTPPVVGDLAGTEPD
ncbi:MAG: hypothetical protein R3348_08920 [Xanthomonadales bacterium]|nr:hypothetical protein [Xanthomonadales bacterium]